VWKPGARKEEDNNHHSTMAKEFHTLTHEKVTKKLTMKLPIWVIPSL
jgi:hypothetical protein